MSLNKRQYKFMLDDICSEDCDREKECILKEFLISSHPSPKMLVQLKCIDKYKEVIAEREKKKVNKISWNQAFSEWAENGFAKIFSDVYEEGIQYRTIYNKVVKGS